MTRKLGFVALFLCVVALLTLPLRSQVTHYCDIAHPVTGTGNLGQSVTLSVCTTNKDANGNQVTITGWALYDNGVRVAPLVFTQGTTSTVSGLQLYTYTFTLSASGLHTYQVASIDSFGEGTKSDPFALTVSATGVPVKPTNLSATVS